MSNKRSRSKDQPIISAAVDLLLNCSGYMHDMYSAEGDNENHIETYYAIDNDVIALYLEPESRSYYLSLFGEKANSLTTKLLAFLIGDFLFQSKEPLIQGHGEQKCRFLIIPPHDEELIQCLNAIHRKLYSATSNIHPKMFEDLCEIFAEYDKCHDNDKLLANLQERVTELVELFNPYKGPRAALSRFASLPDTIFHRIDTYCKDNFAFPVLDSAGNRDDRNRADDLIARWEKLLKRSASPEKPSYAILRDAEVLATLEHINTCLVNDNKQVVLITGANYLFSAAKKYKPWGEGRHSFAEKYLRHPQAFLVHPKFFLLSEQTSSDKAKKLDAETPFVLSEWLSLFFPSAINSKIQNQTTVVPKFIDMVQRQESPDYDGLIQNKYKKLRSTDLRELVDGWKKQVLSVAKLRYSHGLDSAEERGLKHLAESLIKIRRNKSEWSIENIREMIIKESITNTSSLYSITAFLVGLWSQAVRKVSKGIPVLRFDGKYRAIEKYCVILMRILLKNNSKYISKRDSEELHALNKEVEEADTSLYHAHVVHSLAFMAKGHWNASLTLAKTALTISDNLEASIGEVRRGREAAYLACIALRRLVRKRTQLQTAYEYLNEALEREEDGLLSEDIRFTVERLMLDVRGCYFQVFCEEELSDLSKIVDATNKLYETFLDSKKEENELVKLWVQRQILTHFFTLLLIIRDVHSTDDMIKNFNIHDCVLSYENLIGKVDVHYLKPDDDPYASLISSISIAIWDKDSNKRNRNITDGLKHLKNIIPSLPYDSNRLKLLKRCLEL